MDGLSVSDYGIFSNAISTTSTVTSKFTECSSAITEVSAILSDTGVFMGPIAEECVKAVSDLNSDLGIIGENFNSISNYLGQTSQSYQKTDADASGVIQLKLNGVTANSSSTTLSGSSNEEQIWNYLKSQGFSNAGIAGIMGNLQQESGLRPDNVQNGMGYEDADYVAGIKNGTISRDDFIHDSRGFGIAQWTYYTRKAALYDTLGPENIDSLSGQLDFMISEMGNDLTSQMKNASDVASATNTFENVYERAGTPNMDARRSNAANYYDKYNS